MAPLAPSLSSSSLNVVPTHSFAWDAQQLGRGIGEVTCRLEKLVKLAKRSSLFHDPTRALNDQIHAVETDLATLHVALDTLDKRAGERVHASSSKHEANNTIAIVDDLKHQLVHTTTSFRDALRARVDSLRKQHLRRREFEDVDSSSASSSSSSSTRQGGNPFEALLVRAAVEATNGGGGGGDDVSSTALQVLAPNVARASADDAYLTSRAHAVENVERTLVELGEMYTRLAHIVEAQAEITVRIDANMDAAIEHVDAGHRHLLTYHDSIGQSRWLIAKVFAVLLAFLVFFMLFIA